MQRNVPIISADEILKASIAIGSPICDVEAAEWTRVVNSSMSAYERIMKSVPPRTTEALTLDVRGRLNFEETPAEDNGLNAWVLRWKVPLSYASEGKLAGKTIALKDNIEVAGSPLRNGTGFLRYIPSTDATVVTRALQAGALLVGKAQNEYMCLSGSSHTSFFGPVLNPLNKAHVSGGSSSGCGALVGGRHVWGAIGGDQGGSIRIPSAWCGVVGMKPTHGLVPYTGCVPIEMTLDHAGPITQTVRDNALFLEVLSGPDGLDPRQVQVVAAAPRSNDYSSTIGRGAQGVKVAKITEGFGRDSVVDAVVDAALEKLKALGATVDEVSVPMHLDGSAIFFAICCEGLDQLLEGPTGVRGSYSEGLICAIRNGLAGGGALEYSHSHKIAALINHLVKKKFGTQYYARSQNLSRALAAVYDGVLRNYDLIAMPTLPICAPKVPQTALGPADSVELAFCMTQNTSPFNCTGHPALTIPAGLDKEGCGIGLMFVGRHYDEAKIYQVAAALEEALAH